MCFEEGYCEVPLVPSRLICGESRLIPRAMTTVEVTSMVSKFGDAAYRTKQEDFDGVEIDGSGGFLVSDFFSLCTNKRIDKYGGNILDRCRFALEIIADIKKKCGSEFPVGLRLCADEQGPGRLSVHEITAIAAILEDGGLDYINIADKSADEIKRTVNIPVIGLEETGDAFIADVVIKQGNCDFVSMDKASIADPEMPKKLSAGRFDEIIACIGCRQGCSARINKFGFGSCALNLCSICENDSPAATSTAKKSVLVVGGGVGGMQAAITAARAGHSVTLIEQNNHLGGQFCFAAMPPEKGEITAFIVWQQTQLTKLGVMILMDTEATPDLIDALEPNVVVVATGAVPLVSPIQGAKKQNVFTPQQVFEGECLPGSHCVVVGGGIVGCETAQYLEHHGVHVTAIVESLPDILQDMPDGLRSYFLRIFSASDTRIMTQTAAKKISDGGVIVAHDGNDKVLEADFIVMATGYTLNNKLLKQLSEKPYQVFAVGDVIKARSAHETIRESFEVIQSLQYHM